MWKDFCMEIITLFYQDIQNPFDNYFRKRF